MPELEDTTTHNAKEKESAESRSAGFTQLSAVIKGKGSGKTRLEALQELDYGKIEILPTNEIRLPSGKIIGHRDYKHIYRQRIRPTDDREQVVINKL